MIFPRGESSGAINNDICAIIGFAGRQCRKRNSLAFLRGEMIMGRHALRTILLMVFSALLLSMSVFAKDYTKKGTYEWILRDGLYYAIDAQTGDLIRNCKVGKCYVDKNGTRILNQFVKGTYYNTAGFARPKFKGGWIKSGENIYYFANKKMATGYRKIKGKYYYFSSTGIRLSGLFFVDGKYRFFKANGVQVTSKGWRTINGKKYFLSKGGIIAEGFFTVDKKKYYQQIVSGIVTGEQVIDGKKYYFGSDGVYDEEMTKRIREKGSLGNEADMLFFTKFESGSVGYAQTGGDSGKACGKYQFDYRYALIPFLQYCYREDPAFFEGFKPFLGIKPGDSSLVGNKKLFSAWKDCYDADPSKFSAMQDKYAQEAYYKKAETILAEKGVHLSTRPYVIRGAVFSYSIQEGAQVAADAVIAAGISDTTTNQDFLEKLYDYRWKDPRGWNKRSVFIYRYTQEKELALSVLKQAVGAA